MDIEHPWLAAPATRLTQLMERGKTPHALLVDGPPGTGRLALVKWLVQHVLGGDAPLAVDEQGLVQHPDLLWACPPEDKSVIPIERVRELIDFVQLTAHQGGSKIAVVTPAEGLSHAAANSLLKTLEEPPPDSLLILVATSPGRLPATVVSRCQRLRVPLPAREQALAWLKARDASIDWAPILTLAGGSPLKALVQHDNGFAAVAAELSQDLAALEASQTTALAVARRWAKLGERDCADWLYRRTAAELRRRVAGEGDSPTLPLQNSGEGLNMDHLFSYLREVADFQRLQGKGLNPELGLAQLLDHWYGGFGRASSNV